MLESSRVCNDRYEPHNASTTRKTMLLSHHDLKQIDQDYLESLPPGKLLDVSLKLLEDLKEAHDRLNQSSRNSSRPSGSYAPWEGSVVNEGGPDEDENQAEGREGQERVGREAKEEREAAIKMSSRRKKRGSKKGTKDMVAKWS